MLFTLTGRTDIAPLPNLLLPLPAVRPNSLTPRRISSRLVMGVTNVENYFSPKIISTPTLPLRPVIFRWEIIDLGLCK